MGCDIEIDTALLKHLIAVFFFRGCTVVGYYLMFMDAFMAGFTRYPALKTKYLAGSFKNTTAKRNSKDLYCNFQKKWSEKELNLMFGVHHFTIFVFVGFLGATALIFVIQLVVNIRLILFPIPPQTDKKGLPIVSKWEVLKTWSYRLSTLIGDLPGTATAVALYAMIRGKDGMGCWECQLTTSCINKKTFTKLIFPSELALDILYPAVVVLTFYKAYHAYYTWSDPMLCDCHCKPLRCCTGTFLSMLITMLMMTPGWMVLNNYYYSKKGIKKDFVSSLTEKMMLMGIIIWAVLIMMACCIPIKNKLLAEKKDEKKK